MKFDETIAALDRCQGSFFFKHVRDGISTLKYMKTNPLKRKKMKYNSKCFFTTLAGIYFTKIFNFILVELT